MKGKAMHALPPLALLAGTVTLGLYMALQYLRGRQNRHVMIGLHFFLGAAATETFMLVLHGTPDGGGPQSGPLGTAGLIALGLALFSGLMMPLLARSYPRSMTYLLGLHATVALSAVGTILYFVSTLAPA